MTPRRLVVIGGGEHARVVVEAALSQPSLWKVTGFVDPLPCGDTAHRLGIVRLGDDDAEWGDKTGDAVWGILGIGSMDPAVRRNISARFARRNILWASVIHNCAWISPTARIDEGVFVGPGAIVNSGAWVGAHSVVNSGAVIEHDVEVSTFAQIGSGAVIGGGSSIGSGSFVGLGSRIRDHVRVGIDVIVGMGAAVVANVPDGQTVLGIPARAL